MLGEELGKASVPDDSAYTVRLVKNLGELFDIIRNINSEGMHARGWGGTLLDLVRRIHV